jgi:hypothetical protein
MKLSKSEKDKIKKEFKDAEDRVLAKVMKRAIELSKDPELMAKIEDEVKREYAKQTLCQRNQKRKKAS